MPITQPIAFYIRLILFMYYLCIMLLTFFDFIALLTLEAATAAGPSEMLRTLKDASRDSAFSLLYVGEDYKIVTMTCYTKS